MSNQVKLPLLLRTRPSEFDTWKENHGLVKRMAEARQRYREFCSIATQEEFIHRGLYTCTDGGHHDWFLEFRCFSQKTTDPVEILVAYFKQFAGGQPLPEEIAVYCRETYSQIATMAHSLLENGYDDNIMEFILLLFSLEYYYAEDKDVSPQYISAVMTTVFECYPLDYFRRVANRINETDDILNRVARCVEKLPRLSEDEKTSRALEWLCMLNFFVWLFPPTKKNIKRVKKYLQINYKFMRDNNCLNMTIEKVFLNLFDIVDVIED